MKLISLKNPETAVEVFLMGVLEVLVLVGNYVVNGPGPAPLAVVVIVLAITAWILWADYRIIKRDSLYPYADYQPEVSNHD